jgi:hypothetical protein
MTVTVAITTYQVPFDPVLIEVQTFESDSDAVAFINDHAEKWFIEHEGARCLVEMANDEHWHGEPYTPITSLFDHVRLDLWGGESGFEAVIDKASYWRLHEAHYKSEYDDKGKARPGYLLNAYAAEG